mgnify:CR=1 FL=1
MERRPLREEHVFLHVALLGVLYRLELIQRTPGGKRNNGATTIPRRSAHVIWDERMRNYVEIDIELYVNCY